MNKILCRYEQFLLKFIKINFVPAGTALTAALGVTAHRFNSWGN
jgi:hypothetical protein